MAFYRVTLWTIEGKVLQGIRELDNCSIDYATNYFRGLALKAGLQVYDIEAAMLSNKCAAVRQYMEDRQKRKARKAWNESSPPIKHGRRKDSYGKPGPTLGERNKPE